MSATEPDASFDYTDVDKDEHTLTAIWTCDNDDLPDREEHVMDEETVDSLDIFSDEYLIHHHSTCMDCESYKAHYEGSLDRVEVENESGEIIGVIQPETLADEFDMKEF